MNTLIMTCIIKIIKLQENIHEDICAKYQNLINLLKSKILIVWYDEKRCYCEFNAIDVCNIFEISDNYNIKLTMTVPCTNTNYYFVEIALLKEKITDNIKYTVVKKKFACKLYGNGISYDMTCDGFTYFPSMNYKIHNVTAETNDNTITLKIFK